MTNIEAMHLGRSVISSNFIAMHEIGFNSYLYFKNNNHHDLAQKWETFLYNKPIKKILVEKFIRVLKYLPDLIALEEQKILTSPFYKQMMF